MDPGDEQYLGIQSLVWKYSGPVDTPANAIAPAGNGAAAVPRPDDSMRPTTRSLWRGTEPEAAELRRCIDNRAWMLDRRPFPHVTASGVFTPDVYEVLVADFRAAMSSHGTYVDLHDLLGTAVTESMRGAVRIFTSRAWHDLLADVLSVPACGYVNLSLHHHELGSAHGAPHNDLNLGWFTHPPTGDTTVLPGSGECRYSTGVSAASQTSAYASVRSATMIYYLDNPPWKPGDGGETGLYRHGTASIHAPEVRIPPLNNSLLAFACSPWSFHGFLSNLVSPRNSIILWLHQSIQQCEQRFGKGAIVRYGRRHA